MAVRDSESVEELLKIKGLIKKASMAEPMSPDKSLSESEKAFKDEHIQRIKAKMTAAMQSVPDPRGLAIMLDISDAESMMFEWSLSHHHREIWRGMHHLTYTLKHLKFAVFEDHHCLCHFPKELEYITFVATHLIDYPKSSNFTIVVVIAGFVENDVNTVICRRFNKRNIDISHDIIEPFLPPSAPGIADIPKHFFINTFSEYGTVVTSKLNVPSKGNFLVSHINTESSWRFEYEHVFHTLSNEFERIFESGKEVPEAVVDRPVHLHIDNPQGAPENIASMAESMFPDKSLSEREKAFKDQHIQWIKAEMTAAMQSVPDPRGLAIMLDISEVELMMFEMPLSHHHRKITDGMHHLTYTLNHLKFAVFEDHHRLYHFPEQLECITFVATHLIDYPKSSNFTIVVVIAGFVENDVNSVIWRRFNKRNIDISHDIIEPFLPPSAPGIADIPKHFFINTFSEYGTVVTSKLNVPSKGNFLVSHINTESSWRFEYEHVFHTLSNEFERIFESGKEVPEAVVDRPVHLHIDNPQGAPENIASMAESMSPDKSLSEREKAFKDERIQWMKGKMTIAMQSVPDPRGLAIVLDISEEESMMFEGPLSHHLSEIWYGMHQLTYTLRHLKFAVFEDYHRLYHSPEELECITFAATHLIDYPKSSNFTIVVVIAGLVESDVNSVICRRYNKLNISHDIIEPFLPPSAPGIADIPKHFFINTFSEYGTVVTSKLNVPSKGNFLVSHINTESSWPAVYEPGSRVFHVFHTLSNEFKRIFESGKEVPEAIVDRPVHLHIDNPQGAPENIVLPKATIADRRYMGSLYYKIAPDLCRWQIHLVLTRGESDVPSIQEYYGKTGFVQLEDCSFAIDLVKDYVSLQLPVTQSTKQWNVHMGIQKISRKPVDDFIPGSSMPIPCFKISAEFKGHEMPVSGVISLPLRIEAEGNLLKEFVVKISPSPTLIVYLHPDRRTVHDLAAEKDLGASSSIADEALTVKHTAEIPKGKVSTLDADSPMPNIQSDPNPLVQYALSLLTKSSFKEKIGTWELTMQSSETGVLQFCQKSGAKQSVLAASNFLNCKNILTLSSPHTLSTDDVLKFRKAIVEVVFKKVRREAARNNGESIKAMFAVYCPKGTKENPHIATIVRSSEPFFLRCSEHKDLELDEFPSSLLCWFPEVHGQHQKITLSEQPYRRYVSQFGNLFTDKFAVRDHILKSIFSFRSDDFQVNGVSVGLKTVTVRKGKQEVRPSLVIFFQNQQNSQEHHFSDVDPVSKVERFASQNDLAQKIISAVNDTQERVYVYEDDPHWLKVSPYMPISVGGAKAVADCPPNRVTGNGIDGSTLNLSSNRSDSLLNAGTVLNNPTAVIFRPGDQFESRTGCDTHCVGTAGLFINVVISDHRENKIIHECHYGVTCLHCARLHQDEIDPRRTYERFEDMVSFSPREAGSHVSNCSVHLLDSKGDSEVGSFKCGSYDYPVPAENVSDTHSCEECGGHFSSQLRQDPFTFISDIALFSIDGKIDQPQGCLLKHSLSSAKDANFNPALNWEICPGDSLAALFSQYKFKKERMYTYNNRRDGDLESAELLSLAKIHLRDGSTSPAHLHLRFGYEWDGTFSSEGDSGSLLFTSVQKVDSDPDLESSSDENDYSESNTETNSSSEVNSPLSNDDSGGEVHSKPEFSEPKSRLGVELQPSPQHGSFTKMYEGSALDVDPETELSPDRDTSQINLVFGILSRNTSRRINKRFLAFGFYLQPALDICVTKLFLHETVTQSTSSSACNDIGDAKQQIEKLTNLREIRAGSCFKLGELNCTYEPCLNKCHVSPSTVNFSDNSKPHILLKPCFCSTSLDN